MAVGVGNILYALIPDQYVTYIDRSVIDNNVERSRGYWDGWHCFNQYYGAIIRANEEHISKVSL